MSDIEYLRTYLSFENPGYAVLVTGDWGVGKTTAVKEFCSDRDPVYVSLFGLSSIEELHNAVTLGMINESADQSSRVDKLKNATKEIAERIEGNAGLVVSGIFASHSILSQLVNQNLRKDFDSKRPLIFDDLERSEIPLNSLLGSINQYLEHEELSVICIADESKIKSDADHLSSNYADFKEKLISHTIKIFPDIDALVCKVLANKNVKHLEPFGKKIVTILGVSEINSLRIMKQIIFYTDRFFGGLPKEVQDDEDNTDKLIEEYIIWLSMTLGNPKVNETNIIELFTMLRLGMKQWDNDEIKDQKHYGDIVRHWQHKYFQFGFNGYSNKLKPEFIIENVFHGNFSERLIFEQMKMARLMPDTDDIIRPWKIIMNWQVNSDKVNNQAVDKLRDVINNRSELDPLGILQLSALSLWLSSNKIWNYSIDDSKLELISYIDSVQSRLPDNPISVKRSSGFLNIGFSISDVDYHGEFRQVKDHLLKIIKDNSIRMLKKNAVELVDLLKTEPDAMYEYFESENETESIRYFYPFLHLVDTPVCQPRAIQSSYGIT